MKENLLKIWSVFKMILLFLWNILLNWTVGIFILLLGTLTIFLMGVVVWLIGGYKGVEGYFSNLKPKV